MPEQTVTLNDILAAKELRYQRQQAMRKQYNSPLISITINMPGPVKDKPVCRQLLDYALQQLRLVLQVTAEDIVYPATGPEALLAVRGDAVKVKQAAVLVEEQHSFGRLLDIDVFMQTGELLSRQAQGIGRSCLICGELAVSCMRERRHSLGDLERAVETLLNDFAAYRSRVVTPAAEKIGSLAVEAMLYEAASTPAPGLVDRLNSGAHRDMDFYSFMASSAALSLTMARTAQAGLQHGDAPLPALLPVLRAIGREGEAAMLAATGGVNTQKGLLFCLGIITAAAGWRKGRGADLNATDVLDTAAQIVAGIVERELGVVAEKQAGKLTAGERLYLKYGVTGIRGELAAGMPGVRNHALAELRQSLAGGFTVNDALINTLLKLMTCVEDTTVMNRHDLVTMRTWVREKAETALAAGGMGTVRGRQAVADLDEEFIAKNVSPGGAADLLAVTWFLHRLEEEA